MATSWRANLNFRRSHDRRSGNKAGDARRNLAAPDRSRILSVRDLAELLAVDADAGQAGEKKRRPAPRRLPRCRFGRRNGYGRPLFTLRCARLARMVRKGAAGLMTSARCRSSRLICSDDFLHHPTMLISGSSWPTRATTSSITVAGACGTLESAALTTRSLS